MAETVDPPRCAEAQPARERPQQPDVTVRIGDDLADGRAAPQPRDGKPLRRLAEVSEGTAAVLDAFPPRPGAAFARGQDFAQQRLVPPIEVRRGGGMNGRLRDAGGVCRDDGRGRMFKLGPLITQELENDKTTLRTKSCFR